jgi:hypothetical protein
MDLGAASPRTSLAAAVSVGEKQALVTFVGRYLRVWGLVDALRAEQAATRLVAVTLATGEAQSPHERKRRILFLTRKWIEEFARGASGSADDWFWRAQSLLARYPRAFLETPLPLGRGREEASVKLLPEPEPRPMIQQTITDSFERVAELYRVVFERMRRIRSVTDAEPAVVQSSS